MAEKKNGKPAVHAPAPPNAEIDPGGSDGQHCLILATPQEAQKLLTALGEDAILIKLMAPRRKGGE